MQPEAKFNFLATTTWHFTAYIGPILVKQGQSPASLSKIAVDFATACLERISRESGLAMNTRNQNERVISEP